jgi:hypothetical protein
LSQHPDYVRFFPIDTRLPPAGICHTDFERSTTIFVRCSIHANIALHEMFYTIAEENSLLRFAMPGGLCTGFPDMQKGTIKARKRSD